MTISSRNMKRKVPGLAILTCVVAGTASVAPTAHAKLQAANHFDARVSASRPRWHWADQGVPVGTGISSTVGVLSVMDSPTAPQRPYAFVLGNDGDLWVNWWDGSRWHWADQGVPAGTGISSTVGVLSVMDSPTAPQRPYAFVLGNDGDLWVNWWYASGGSGHPVLTVSPDTINFGYHSSPAMAAPTLTKTPHDIGKGTGRERGVIW